MQVHSIFPFDQSVLETYELFSDRKIQQTIDLADTVQKRWREQPISLRAFKMIALGDILRKKRDRLAKMISLEMGKIKSESLAEVDKCAWLCDYYAENTEKFLAPESYSTEMRKSYVSFQPIGTVLAVMPWNFPFWQVFRAAVPAILAGNVMLLKHASNVFGSALLIEQLFLEAGFQRGVFSTLLISSGQVPQVLKAFSVRGVALTGSEKAGAAVASLAGKNIKRQVLELGGSDPFIVLKDADINQAAEVAVQSRMLNAGQSCIAAKRFIVQQAVWDEFMRAVTQKTRAFKLGHPLEDKNTMGPMARLDLAAELMTQLDRGVQSGAHIISGGSRDQCLFEPTLVELKSRDNILAQEEIFGPIMPIIPFKTEKEAILIANDSRYGLGGSVWTEDPDRGEALALQVEAGAVFVNGMVRSDPRLPFGGIKDSGYGRELSKEGIREFVNKKTVVVE